KPSSASLTFTTPEIVTLRSGKRKSRHDSGQGFRSPQERRPDSGTVSKWPDIERCFSRLAACHLLLFGALIGTAVSSRWNAVRHVSDSGNRFLHISDRWHSRFLPDNSTVPTDRHTRGPHDDFNAACSLVGVKRIVILWRKLSAVHTLCGMR